MKLTATGLCILLPLLLASCGAAASDDTGKDSDMSSENHPGAEPYPLELSAELAAALHARGEGYEPRTHHFTDGGAPRYTNRLILEDSPYLLQHAHNPVDWYSWGDAYDPKRAIGSASVVHLMGELKRDVPHRILLHADRHTY